MVNVGQNSYIDPKAQLADDVSIGPNCYIGPDVVIEAGCKLHNNVTITGKTRIGINNEFYQNSVIGTDPQDLKFKGGDTELIIGSHNIFRENVTVHRGTELGGGKTIIGNGNLFMAGVHIAHDCEITQSVIIANNALIAGHVRLEQSTVIGGGAGIHHFVTVGRNAMVGGLTRVVKDVPPFMIFEGNPASVRGVNIVGLSRNGFTPEQIENIKQAYRKLFKSQSLQLALKEIRNTNNIDENVKYLIEFLERSFLGRHGRYLETIRTDSADDIKKLLEKDEKQKSS